MNENEKKIDFELTDETAAEEMGGVSLDDVKSGKYIQTVKVGQETDWLKITDFVQKTPTEYTDKLTGKKFSDALKPLTPKEGQKLYAYYLKTEQGAYRITSWEVFFKIKEMKNLLKFPKWSNCNVEIKISHEFDGMGRDATNQKAKEEGRLFKVQVKDNGVVKTIVSEQKGKIKVYKLV